MGKSKNTSSSSSIKIEKKNSRTKSSKNYVKTYRGHGR